MGKPIGEKVLNINFFLTGEHIERLLEVRK